MIEELKRIKYNFFPLILFFTIFLYLIIAKPYIDDNTYTYTQFTLIRQPVYSIFLNSFRWAGEHQFQLIMWVQGLLTFLSLLYARRWLKTRLALSDYFILPVFFIILFTISFYYQIRSVDDPEGITFPIFIITFFILLECFYHFEIKKIIYLNFLVSLLILTLSLIHI